MNTFPFGPNKYTTPDFAGGLQVGDLDEQAMSRVIGLIGQVRDNTVVAPTYADSRGGRLAACAAFGGDAVDARTADELQIDWGRTRDRHLALEELGRLGISEGDLDREEPQSPSVI